MLERLIKITNSETFIQSGHMAIKEVVARQREFDLKVSFEIQNAVFETKQLDCEIYCENVFDIHRVHEYKRPYNRFNLYSDHPLLWNCNSTQYLRLKGQNANMAELMGELFLAHDKVCGNWVDYHRLFRNLPKRLTSDKGATLEVPQQLISTYLPLFDKYQLSYSLGETRETKNNYSVLLFGNPDICPDSYNLGQPYIIAERFTEQVTAANT